MLSKPLRNATSGSAAKRKLLPLLFGLLSVWLMACSAGNVRGCDHVLGICLRTYQDSEGALVTDVSGTLARDLRHEGESIRYILMAGQHVIKAVNGKPVSTKEECIQELKLVEGQVFTIDVYNIQKDTLRTYTAASSSNGSATDDSTSDDDRNASIGNSKLVRDSATGQLKPSPGYVWISKRDHSRGVKWKPRSRHPHRPGIYASRTEGKWLLMSGYEWDSRADLTTRYVGGSDSDEFEFEGDVDSESDSDDSESTLWTSPSMNYLEFDRMNFNLNYSSNPDHRSVYGR